jgi:hypothetical protein
VSGREETVSVVVPAYREAGRIGTTVAAIRRASRALGQPVELIVVDDGSDDDTVDEAAGADLLLCEERNHGKGAAVSRGLAAARGKWIVLLDADLGETAGQFPHLLLPVQTGRADMTIAILEGARRAASDVGGRPWDGAAVDPVPTRELGPLPHVAARPAGRGGFGLALRTARWGVERLTGRVLTAPLSGQRALAAAHLPLLLPLEPGFGLEVGLDIDALRAGLRVLEVPTGMRHAGSGRDWAGFRHRGRQMAHILRALWARRQASTTVAR